MSPGWWDIAPSSLAQWVGAAATFAAVVVALFKDPILTWMRRPRLVVTCTKDIPCTVKTPITAWQGQKAGGGKWNGEGYFVRIIVRNTGRTRAEKVQVSALSLAKQGADHGFADIQTALPFNMKWSNSPPNAAVTVLDGISREMSAFCDVIALCEPDNPYQRRPKGTPPYPEPVTVGQLQMEFDPAEEWHLLAPGTYRLTLRVGAANVEPIDEIIEFTHDGKWTEDDVTMRRDHLGVSLK
jgi:hypothetical protein